MKRLAGDGWSSGKIANQMGITRNAVIGKVHRLGVKLRGMAPDGQRFSTRGGWPRQAKAPEVEQLPITVPAPERHVTIWDLKADRCRWPMWGHADHPTRDSFYCGCETAGHTYCAYHSWVAARGNEPEVVAQPVEAS